ncbi:MAG TPA: nickel pincer cofactor biosynthesis protein LarB [Thermomicrobiales bacterium]|jgi:hypothetical protein|nr:nickel pincer cofactor biosynthesis protein LarB [Thermomicrobiales bacterium]
MTETRDPFAAVRRALATSGGLQATDPVLEVDTDRRSRTGDPEIVYGQGKRPDQVRDALDRLAATNGRAVATRCTPETMAMIARVEPGTWPIAYTVQRAASIIVARRLGSTEPEPVGLVGILAAGASDHVVVAEIETILHESGIGSRSRLDVGVAGLHRLVRPLSSLAEDGAQAIIVVAGMDGALPSVVAGLVDVPVIGVPTSTGYGWGGDGTGALMSMLQTCAPGLTVVNIDNGVGAALAAARIVRSGRRSAP